MSSFNPFRPATRRSVVAATLLSALTLVSTAGQAAGQGGVWSAAWQAPHSDAFLSLSAKQATLRQIITAHADGGRVRIRVSNAHGQAAVQLGAVSIGVSAGGARIEGAGPVPVLFNGQAGVVLAPGESRYSDPVALDVHAMQRLALSIHLPDCAVSMSRHFNGNEFVWKAAGDLTGQASADGFSADTNLLQASHVLVDRLEVDQATTSARRVVAMFGDSITDGFMGTPSGVPLVPGKEPIGRDVRFPDFLQRRAVAERVQASFISAAISGNRLLSAGFLPMFGQSGQSRLERDVLSLAGVTDAIVLIGINDLGFSLTPGLTGQKLAAGLSDLVRTLHEAGIKVTLGTVMPARGASLGLLHGTSPVDGARLKLNDWIRTSGVADRVVDFEACMRDPANPSHLLRAYDSGDALHPNTLGYQAMAACVDLAAYR